MNEFGLKVHRPAIKPSLTQAMKDTCLTFAKKLAKWRVQKWQQVLFTRIYYVASLPEVGYMSIDPQENDLISDTRYQLRSIHPVS